MLGEREKQRLTRRTGSGHDAAYRQSPVGRTGRGFLSCQAFWKTGKRKYKKGTKRLLDSLIGIGPND